MCRFALRVLGRALGLSLLLGALPALAATHPTLFSISVATPRVLAQGAQKSWQIQLNEDSAMQAVFQGGMWLPNPAGGRIYVKYSRHILHPNGTWTFIGKVETVHGEQSAVLTFGKGSVFGLIPQASGYPLRIVTSHGETRVVETSAQAMARSPEALQVHSGPDFRVPPRVAPGAAANVRRTQRAASRAQPARGVAVADVASSGPVTIDVMVAYTPGFVSELGGVYTALTRIQNLVDITNQAYTDSAVNQQIRLVHTVEVNYPDNTSNASALDDITGLDSNGDAVPIPSSLQNIAPLRTQYGADLVTLVRSFQNATQSGCGEGWLIGGGEVPIVPSQDYIWGYNVVSDGSNGGYYCLDTTFAHELGHNMGDAHDRAHANGPGAYPYSYGYVGGGTYGFSTIMAYGTSSQTPLAVFSNPNSSTCQNQPCGVPDSSSNSADNAHSMNNTAALIAAFESTMVNDVPALETVHNDITGSGSSDLLWYNPTTQQMTYWVMNGPTMALWQGFSVPSGYQPIATGDFDGNGDADILWQSSSGGLYMWLSNGSLFTSEYVGAYPIGWVLGGVADINNDGKSDLLWYNPSTGQMAYWLMNGSILMQWNIIQTVPRCKMMATGNFDGNGYSDIVWITPDNSMYMWLFKPDGSFTYYNMGQYPSGWVFAGTGDVNGDGKTDLFWYNPVKGQMTYWLMNGPNLMSWQGFTTLTGLTPLATGIFDGTSAGLTWQSQDGGMYMWLFNVFDGSLNWYFMGSYPSGWIPIP